MRDRLSYESLLDVSNALMWIIIGAFWQRMVPSILVVLGLLLLLLLGVAIIIRHLGNKRIRKVD